MFGEHKNESVNKDTKEVKELQLAPLPNENKWNSGPPVEENEEQVEEKEEQVEEETD